MPKIASRQIRLSTTTKLGCLSLGLPPLITCPMQGQICKVCYARLGTASFANVAPVLYDNYSLIKEQTACVSAKQIAEQISDDEFFRWFWSGDAFSKKMVKVVVETAKRTPSVKHWVASRNLAVWDGVDLPDNVTFRSSSPRINDFSGKYGSTSLSPEAVAPDSVFECPGDCRRCRFCWQKSTSRTPAYRFHGSAVAKCVYKKYSRLGELPA